MLLPVALASWIALPLALSRPPRLRLADLLGQPVAESGFGSGRNIALLRGFRASALFAGRGFSILCRGAMSVALKPCRLSVAAFLLPQPRNARAGLVNTALPPDLRQDFSELASGPHLDLKDRFGVRVGNLLPCRLLDGQVAAVPRGAEMLLRFRARSPVDGFAQFLRVTLGLPLPELRLLAVGGRVDFGGAALLLLRPLPEIVGDSVGVPVESVLHGLRSGWSARV